MQATRSFQASLCLDNQNITLDIQKGQNLKDFTQHIVQSYHLPTHVSVSIYSSIQRAMTCSTTRKEGGLSHSKKELRHLFMDAYQSNTLQYNNKPEEDIFPRAYHTLVHCPIATIFDTLLELEQSYAIAIGELLASGEDEFMQKLEAGATEEEIQAFQLACQSDISHTQQTQRQEYREFVIELYREYQSRLTLLPDLKLQDDALALSKLDGKEIVDTAARRVRRFEPHMDSQHPANRKRTASLASSSLPKSDPIESAHIKSIQEMGFLKDQAETALLLSGGNMEAAIGLLLENPTKVDASIAEQRLSVKSSTSTPYRRSHSLSQVPRPNLMASPPSSVRNDRRHSLQRFSTTPTFLNITTSKSPASASVSSSANNKSWPISFLQQQKQNMENTNLSSMKKLGGWLGKAMENLGIDHDAHKQRDQPQLVESFSIKVGTTQITSSHNLRLLVIDEATEIFHPPYDPPREMAYRAETATKLYTSSLSAAIVLIDIEDWDGYKSGKKSNGALFARCQQSTEFHFADIESQITQIEQDFSLHPTRITEGTFFITKHSNLPRTQVVFHLFIDSTAVVDTDLSNRHPLMIGLRNISKMTTQFDISSISIPLLFLPDGFNEKHDSAWLQKRGEVVMKCIKGFLSENSRSGKRVQNEGLDRAESMGGGGMRNIEFLLPKKPDVYGPISTSTEPTSSKGVPQEVEVAFQQFRALLAYLFRTS
ncbi:hypothetical protein INT47_001771 [Mucor saturninus]|uniref:UBA domain-containing protein n=1 Tax=Mucor saturninus TaxID=64648 RepID=A0A8H7RKV6_9FUNG|nr:hypothetical protein INT47_001771 [Mucor saturninus]